VTRGSIVAGIRTQMTIVSIVETIPTSIAMAALERDRARDLPCGGAHGDEGIITPRDQFVGTELLRPMRTVCAWCVNHDRPAAVLVDVPIDERGLSHGICPACRASFRSSRIKH